MKTILVTGGLGYIGSHTCVVLIEAGYNVEIIDSLCNSYLGALNRIENICGYRPKLHQGDIRDHSFLDKTFNSQSYDAVLHFAGLKAVGESVEIPLEYYEVNVRGTLNLLKFMRKSGVKTIVFSSSATVYGETSFVPIKEDCPLKPTNPYGRSKRMVEEILDDLYESELGWQIACLRYFNPVGAHASGLIGEDPKGVPNNLLPHIAQVAVGRRNKVIVFGDDYPTPDGTGIRDYIHVVDLAEGHLSALEHCDDNGGFLTVNLGTGQGYSVIQMIKAFERASGQNIPFEIAGRRPGDVAKCWADPGLAKNILKWEGIRSIDDMCIDTWRWQSMNPNGYSDQ